MNWLKKGGIDLSKSWFRKSGGDEKVQQKTDGISELFLTLSQFALIGLSRVYCLLGDYTSSIKVLDSIDLSNKTSPFHSTLAAKVTLHYYMGFAYLMLRRYADAVKTFSYFLLYVNRNKHSFPRSFGPDVVDQMVSKMDGLLTIANSLSPQTLDESLQTQLKDRFKPGTPESLFESSCPNFISPAPPDYNQPQIDDNENSRLGPAGRLQKRIFLNEIKQRSNLPQTYGYLKMCTNVHISKLGDFLDFESNKEKEKEMEKERQHDREERKARERQGEGKIIEEKEREREKEKEKEKEKERENEKKAEKERREKEKSNPNVRSRRDEETATILLKLKHKTRNLRWQSSGSASSGRWISSSEVDFYLDKDIVHIGDHTTGRRYGDFFIRSILKYQAMIDELRQNK